jgi:hypothetical protein
MSGVAATPSGGEMGVAFDHLFLCTSGGAPEIEPLLALGLTEGTPNRHPGQGTACRRIFFANAYLEFLWVEDEREARSDPAAPLHLWERGRAAETGWNPFGVGLRPDEPGAPPFPTWAYRPPYLSESMQIEIGENSIEPVEPLIFCIPMGARPDAYPQNRRQPLDHAIGFKEISRLRLTLKRNGPISAPLVALERLGIIEIRAGDAPLVDIGFDREREGQFSDFRPALPLCFHW